MDSKNLLDKRLKRCIKSILNSKERMVDPFVPSDISSQFRTVILDEINSFYSIIIDIIDESSNQEFLDMLEMIEDIHEKLVKE